MGQEYTFEKASAAFRQHIPDLNTPRFQVAQHQDPYEYAEAFRSKQNPPWLYNLTCAWQKLYDEPYKGLTSDGELPMAIPHHYGIVADTVSQETSFQTSSKSRMKAFPSIASSKPCKKSSTKLLQN